MAAPPSSGQYPYGAQPQAYGAAPQGYGGSPAGGASSADRVGVGELKLASLFGIIDQALFWIGFLLFILIIEAFLGLTCDATTGVCSSVPSWITPTTIYAAFGMMIGGAVIAIVAYLFYFLGFRKVKEAAPDFSSPYILVLIGLIGFLMIAGGVGLLIGAIVNGINCAGSTSSSCASGSLGDVLGAIALFGLGSLLGLIGVIGVVLGNWRAGKRYEQSMVKIGGILQIIPFVSIVGFVLCFIGYMNAEKKLKSGWVPGGMAGVYGQPAYAPVVAAPAAGVGGAAYGASPYGQPQQPAYPQQAYGQQPQQPAYPQQSAYQQPQQPAYPQQQAYGQQPQAGYAAAAPSVMPAGAGSCKFCGKPTQFIAQYNRNYCPSCGQYQ